MPDLPAVDYQSTPAASPKPAASTHPYPATPVLAAAVEAELSAAEEEEEEEDISPGPAQAACPSASPIDHSCVEEAVGIQAGSYRVLGRDMLVAVVVGEELVGLWKLLRRLSPGLRLRRDPLGGGLGRLRRRVGGLGVGVRWLWRRRWWRGFSFARERRGVVRVGGC